MSSSLPVYFQSGRRAYFAPKRQIEAMINGETASPMYAPGKRARLIGCILTSLETKFQSCEANRTTTVDHIQTKDGVVSVFRHSMLSVDLRMGGDEDKKGWDQSASAIAGFTTEELEAIARRPKEVVRSRSVRSYCIGYLDGPYCTL